MTIERQFSIATVMTQFRKASPAQKEALFRQTLLGLYGAQDTIALFGRDYAKRSLPLPFEGGEALAPSTLATSTKEKHRDEKTLHLQRQKPPHQGVG